MDLKYTDAYFILSHFITARSLQYRSFELGRAPTFASHIGRKTEEALGYLGDVLNNGRYILPLDP